MVAPVQLPWCYRQNKIERRDAEETADDEADAENNAKCDNVIVTLDFSKPDF